MLIVLPHSFHVPTSKYLKLFSAPVLLSVKAVQIIRLGLILVFVVMGGGLTGLVNLKKHYNGCRA